jgi:hypothetical protein
MLAEIILDDRLIFRVLCRAADTKFGVGAGGWFVGILKRPEHILIDGAVIREGLIFGFIDLLRRANHTLTKLSKLNMRVDNKFLVDLAVLRPCFFPCKDLEEPADRVTGSFTNLSVKHTQRRCSILPSKLLQRIKTNC